MTPQLPRKKKYKNLLTNIIIKISNYNKKINIKEGNKLQ